MPRIHWTQTAAGKKILRKRSERLKAKNQAKTSKPTTKARLAKDEVIALARLGATSELTRLEREIEKLKIFIGGGA